MDYRVGVDLGGTKILAALEDNHGKIYLQRRYSTRAAEGPRNIMGRLANIVAGLFEEANISRAELGGLGLCVAGFYDIHTGKMYSSPNLPGWENFSLRKELTELFAAPAWIENDANAAAYGEYLCGAGKNKNNIIQVTLGTGIGGGIIINGEIYRGAAFAGEIGHITVLPRGPLCGCGNRGCLEALSSGTALAREGRRILRSNIQTSLRQMVEKADDLEAAHVFDAARKGDRAAGKIVKRAAYFLGLGLAGVVNILNPDVIIISGGLMQAGEYFFEPVRRSLRAAAIEPAAKGVTLVAAKLGEEAGIRGILGLLNEYLAKRSLTGK